MRTIITILLLQAQILFGQLAINQNFALDETVQSLFGPDVVVSNVRHISSSNAQSYGYFTGGEAFGISSGLLLTTGYARTALPPNNRPDSGDELSGSTSSGLYDTQIIEFDIVSLTDEISFDYVFGSEEYPEYVEDLYNDYFAFTINGNGYINYNFALVPGTNDEVSISSINRFRNPIYYRESNSAMEYDGFTSVLTARTSVTPCLTYRIQIIIADQRDGIYDSGVFIRGNKNNEAPSVTSEVIYENPRFDYMIEECNNASIRFTRDDNSDINEAQTLYLTYFGGSVPGVDYNSSNFTSITIPANQQTATLDLDAIKDNLYEGTEIIQVSASQCQNTVSTNNIINIPLKDYFEPQIEDAGICSGDEIRLNENYPYNDDFIWTHPGVSCNNCVSPNYQNDTTDYVLFSATDPQSGCVTNDSILISVSYIKADFEVREDICYTPYDRRFDNKSEGSVEYKWFVDGHQVSEETSPIYSFGSWNFEDTTSKRYDVQLITTNPESGCSDTLSKIELIRTDLFVPNIITPNGDGKNDVFKISGFNSDCWTLRIINRWGKTVYETKNYQNDWGGSDLADGVYYFYIFNDSEDREFKGYLQITR